MNKTCAVLALSLISFAGLAQVTPDINSSTGSDNKEHKGTNANSGSSGIYNVNLYDGTASINIPIYDYSIDGLQLGVSLNYDTRGIHVDQIATPTGLGWNLDAAGYIDRDVHGIEDDQMIDGFGTSSSSNPNGYVTCTGVRGELVGPIDSWNTQDKELDIFEAHFAGRSIKFHLRSLIPGAITLTSQYPIGVYGFTDSYPKSHISIKLTLQDQYGSWVPYTMANLFTGSSYYNHANAFYHASIHPASIGFEIIDEHGNMFKFKRGDYHKTYYTVPGVSDADPSAKNPNAQYDFTYYPTEKWVLFQIVTYSGAVVNYNYTQRDGISYPIQREEIIQESNRPFYENFNSMTGFHDGYFKKLSDSAVLWDGGISQLSSIDYPNGTKVKFVAAANSSHQRCDIPATYAVDSIIIANGYDNSVKNELTYRMWYSYLGSIGGAATTAAIFPYSSPCSTIGATYDNSSATNAVSLMKQTLRLRLDSIELVGSNHVAKELYYRFDYNSTPLPKRLSSAQDWYGYYNGQFPTNTVYGDDAVLISSSSQPSSIPLHTFNHQSFLSSSVTYGTDKTPNLSYLQACNLTLVWNGKRGSVSLSYQDHVLSNPTNGYTQGTHAMPVDINGATANDGLCISSIVEKDGYNYQNNLIKTYFFSDGQRFFQGGFYWYPLLYEDQYSGSHPGSILFSIYKNSNIQPHDYLNGSNHGYSHAVVTTKDYNYVALKYEDFDFTNLMDKDYPLVSNLKMPLESYEHTFYPEYFAQFRMGKLLKHTVYDKNSFMLSKEETSYTPLQQPGIDLSPYTNVACNKYFNDWIYHWTYYSTDPDPHINTLQRYYVADVMLPQSQTTTTYTVTGSHSITKSFAYDSRNNILSITEVPSTGISLVQGYSYNYNSSTINAIVPSYLDIKVTSEKYLGSNCISFLKYNNNFMINGVTGTPGLRLYSCDKLICSMPTYSISSSYFKPLTGHTLWDSLGNVVEQKSNDILSTASIWDMRVGKLVATVPNAYYTDIAYTSFEGSFKPLGWRDDNKGNWDFDASNIALPIFGNTTKPITGRYEYDMAHTTSSALVPNDIVSKNNLVTGKQYIISLWASAPPNVAELSTTSTASIPITWAKTVNSWNFYTAVFTAIGGKIDISNSGTNTIKIDELRLYPADAAMTTTTYEPLFGPNSVCDAIGNIVYYEYDIMGRPKLTRDINNNIITVQKTFTQDADQ